MKKYITYEEEELKNVLLRIESGINEIKFWLDMIEEMKAGTRSNIKMEDCTAMIMPALKISDALKEFKLKSK